MGPMRRILRTELEDNRLGGGAGPTGSSAIVTVLIAEDDPLIRETLATVIDGDEGFVVTAMAGDADAAIRAAIELPPDLALLDVRMPGGGGAHAATVIAESCPEVHIVAISAHDDEETIAEMIEAGARGYITKDGPAHQMLDTLRRCAAGESIFTPRSATRLMSQYVKSSQRMETAKRQLREREIRLREACDPASISSVFQPVVDLETGSVVMYEALTRFSCDHGLNTAEWFEEAVHLGMSAELEIAALARTVAALVEHGDDEVNVSVNVSPDTLLSPTLMATLAPIDLSRVVIEITEHAQIQDYAQTKSVFDRLRKGGAKLAIDDAGAGFASLRHILDLMPDIIKLDISLVRGIDSDQPRRALAAGLISFANEIGAEIVAEGIETGDELACLKYLGVHLGQGYILARPAPIDQATAAKIEV